MMLKQSSGRNLRAKSLKVKHALWMFVLLAICLWFLYEIKQSYSKKSTLEERPPRQVSENGENEYQILRMGRKDLTRRLDHEVAAEFDKEEVELEEEEGKVRENEGEQSIDRDEEMDAAGDKAIKIEEDQLQDLIDEDDKDG